MNQETFLALSTAQVAELIRADGDKVCVYPMNGTRRWFMLEHPEKDFKTEYIDTVTQWLAGVIKMLFDHGIRTLVVPMLSPHIFQHRSEEYIGMALAGTGDLAISPRFMDFYQSYHVRVRFYGEYEDYLRGGPFEHLIGDFNHAMETTQEHDQFRLLWGFCAHDATETTAKLSVEHFQNFGEVPSKEQLIEMYYGLAVPPVSIFISASKLRAFDMPLISNGREDLYYTVAPSPYLTAQQLKAILHDHLYNRKKNEVDYQSMTDEDWQVVRKFYHDNVGNTIGVGTMKLGMWWPLPQVKVPPY